MKALGTSFKGTINADGNEAVGIFTQGGQSIPLTLLKSDPPLVGAKAAANEQIWQGKLSVAPGIALRLVVHLIKGKDDALTATFDSSDQGAKA